MNGLFYGIILYVTVLMTLLFLCIVIAFIKGSRTEKKEREANETQIPDSKTSSAEPYTPRTELHRRFAMLSEIDRSAGSDEGDFFANVALEDICQSFRHFAAENLKLYYSIDDIRSFVAGMAVSHFLLLQGISGTGKTSLAYAFGQFLSHPTTIVPIQPMWKESSDMLGYYNEFTRRYNETNMIAAMYRALYTQSMCLIVLDEINIARVEYYFAEFLSLLELPDPDMRKIRVVSGREPGDPQKLPSGEIRLAENIWFVGTANNDDSTFAISDKVYDRAMIVNLDHKAEVFDAPPTAGMRISGTHFDRLVKEAVTRYAMTDRNRRRLALLDRYLQKNLHISFGNRIMRQMEKYVAVYIACGGSEIDAIDDLLSKKILRKLDMQNPIYIKNTIADLNAYIDEIYGEGTLPLCRAYLHRLEISV